MILDALPLLEQLKAIANLGLHYSKDVYDRGRYEQIMTLVQTYYGHALEMPPSEVHAQFRTQLGQLSISPIVGADAAIFDSSGKILLMKRTDNSKWCLPCGLVEAGESPEQAAVREAREETGLEVKILELVGVYTRLPNKEYGLYSLVSMVYQCEVTGGTLQRSHEDLGLQYWNLEEVPIWHSDMEQKARDAQAKYRTLMTR
jgi:ADP-ribose pyrophosphatase YjhB (NUDIX family)